MTYTRLDAASQDAWAAMRSSPAHEERTGSGAAAAPGSGPMHEPGDSAAVQGSGPVEVHGAPPGSSPVPSYANSPMCPQTCVPGSSPGALHEDLAGSCASDQHLISPGSASAAQMEAQRRADSPRSPSTEPASPAGRAAAMQQGAAGPAASPSSPGAEPGNIVTGVGGMQQDAARPVASPSRPSAEPGNAADGVGAGQRGAVRAAASLGSPAADPGSPVEGAGAARQVAAKRTAPSSPNPGARGPCDPMGLVATRTTASPRSSVSACGKRHARAADGTEYGRCATGRVGCAEAATIDREAAPAAKRQRVARAQEAAGASADCAPVPAGSAAAEVRAAASHPACARADQPCLASAGQQAPKAVGPARTPHPGDGALPGRNVRAADAQGCADHGRAQGRNALILRMRGGSPQPCSGSGGCRAAGAGCAGGGQGRTPPPLAARLQSSLEDAALGAAGGSSGDRGLAGACADAAVTISLSAGVQGNSEDAKAPGGGGTLAAADLPCRARGSASAVGRVRALAAEAATAVESVPDSVEGEGGGSPAASGSREQSGDPCACASGADQADQEAESPGKGPLIRVGGAAAGARPVGCAAAASGEQAEAPVEAPPAGGKCAVTAGSRPQPAANATCDATRAPHGQALPHPDAHIPAADVLAASGAKARGAAVPPGSRALPSDAEVRELELAASQAQARRPQQRQPGSLDAQGQLPRALPRRATADAVACGGCASARMCASAEAAALPMREALQAVLAALPQLVRGTAWADMEVATGSMSLFPFTNATHVILRISCMCTFPLTSAESCMDSHARLHLLM